MITVFERVPDRFIEMYDGQLQAWARNFRKVGRVGTIMLRRPVEPLAVASDQRRIVGVRLEAFPDGDGMVIRPQTDADEEAIKRHVIDMRSVLN